MTVAEAEIMDAFICDFQKIHGMDVPVERILYRLGKSFQIVEVVQSIIVREDEYEDEVEAAFEMQRGR